MSSPGTSVPSGGLVTPGGNPGQIGIPGGAVPTGVLLDFAGSVAPPGFLMADGALYSTTTYANLFGVIGYTFGGSGSSFAVPDCRGKASIGVGQGSGLTNRLLAATGGEEAHQLTTAELASHGHAIATGQFSHSHSIAAGQFSHGHGLADAGHNHYMNWYPATTGLTPGPNAYALFAQGNWTSGVNNQAASGLSVNAATLPAGSAAAATLPAGTASNSGSDTAHNTMPPFLVLGKIIKT